MELPEYCFILHPNADFLPADKRIVIAKRGEQAYWPTEGLPAVTVATAVAEIRRQNEILGVTGLQAYCMKVGALFGFDAKGASPEWVSQHVKHIDFADASGEGARNAD